MLRAHRLLAGGLLGLLAAGLTPGVASAANPSIVEYSKNAPQAVHGNTTYGTVASIHLKAGRWLILAKAELAFPMKGDPAQITTCTLFFPGGQEGQHAYTSIAQPNSGSTAAGVPSGVSEGFTLSVGDSLTAAGNMLMQCYTGAGTNHVFIRQIHITAIKVGKLSIYHSGSTTPTVYGSGAPEAIWVWNIGGTLVPSGGNAYDSSFSVPTGTWMALASSSLYSTTATPSYGHCSFNDIGDSTDASWRTSATGTTGAQQALTAQLEFHRTFPGSPLYWHCFSSVGSVRVQYTYFALVRLTRLAEETGSSTVITGSGSPSAYFTDLPSDQWIASAHPANLTRPLRLTAGSWIVLGYVDTSATINKSGVVHCKLKVGSAVLDQADTSVVYKPGTVFLQELVFNGRVTLPSAKNVTMSCSQSGATGDVGALNYHLTALQGVVKHIP